MWISNTATVAMMFPIGLSLLAVLESHARPCRAGGVRHRRCSSRRRFAASIGGLARRSARRPNLIGIGFVRRETGVALPFFSWMALGVPVGLLTPAFAGGACSRRGAPPAGRLAGVGAAHRARARGARARGRAGQVNTLVAFGLTVALLGRSRASSRSSRAGRIRSTDQLTRALPEGVVAILGADAALRPADRPPPPRVHAAVDARR